MKVVADNCHPLTCLLWHVC